MISLYDILEASGGQLFGEPIAQIFTNFCFDPGEVTPNALFVALKSDYGDTHHAIEQAIADGATGIICNRPPDSDTHTVSVIMVRDSVDALMAWSRYILDKSSVKVIGVTGSSGKSGAVEAIYHILSTRYSVLVSSNAYSDNRLHLPDALAYLKSEHQFIVLRLGATQPGELAALALVMQPDVGVVTNVHHSHLDHFDDTEQMAQEYRQLIQSLPEKALAVLNYDDDLVRAMSSHIKANVSTISVESFGATMMGYNVVLGPDGTGFDLRYAGERHVAKWIPILGKHQLYGVLAALTVGVHFGIALEDALRSLAELPGLPGRMAAFAGLNDSILIDDTHSANPESTTAALDWLNAVKDERQRVIVVLGDMDHLGAYSQIGHRTIGRKAAEVAGLLITEGGEAAAAGRAALDWGMDARTIRVHYSAEDTITALTSEITLTDNDIVLVKGGPSTRMNRLVKALLKYPEDADRLEVYTSVSTVDTAFQPLRPTWVEINTEAIAQNVRAIKQMLDPNVTLMAVVKADGYGHGAVAVAQTALLNGAEYLAVANLEEALELRYSGINAPILVLGYTPVYAVRQALRQNIAVTLYDLDMARAYARAAREANGRLRVHVKIDTGMGRLGLMPDEAVHVFRQLGTLNALEVEGIYTHFSSADEDIEFTAQQVETFRNVIRPLRAGGFNFPYIHAANSAGTVTSKDNHFTMVRVGLALYGLHPSEKIQLPDPFKPVMTWKTVIAQVKTLPSNHYVGYGNTYRTRGPETIAVLPIGYADGFRRWPTWGEVLVKGQRAPIVGRISMEKTSISVGHIPGVAVGDEVVLLGTQGDERITAEEIALRLGTINYEVVCNILARVPRR